MNRNLLMSCLLLVSLSGPALAGYRELKAELEAYQPPVYVFKQPAIKAAITPLATDEAFDTQGQKLAASKQHWQVQLAFGKRPNQFFPIHPEQAKVAKKAQKDIHGAAQLVEKNFSLERIEIMTRVRNPGIKEAEMNYRAAVESFSQVSQLDAILKQYSAFTEGVMPGVGPMKARDPIKMKFPFPGILALKGKITAKTVEEAWENLEIARRNAITEARNAFWRLVYVHRARVITREMVELLQHLDAVATTRYESGKTSYQDVVKVRIQWETIAEELITLDERQRMVEAKLGQILNLPPRTITGIPLEPTADYHLPKLEGLYATAGEKRQEIRKVRIRSEKMQLMIEMAETMIQPPYTLGHSFYEDEAIQRVGSAATKAPFETKFPVSRGAGLPKLPWYGTDDAYLRQTREKLAALEHKLQKTEAQTVFLVRKSWFELDRAHREEVLYRDTVVELSQTALDVATRGYESGKVLFADVISAYTTWLKAHLTLARKRSDLGVARAELARAVGTDM